jgi:serine/threonine protein kinase
MARPPHHHGIVPPRPIKPDNVFLLAVPQVMPALKVLDFGWAKLASSAVPSTTDSTMLSGQSPRYMSPEAGGGRPQRRLPQRHATTLGCIPVPSW